MKYHVQVVTFGSLRYWVVSPEGRVVATFNNSTRADRCVDLINKNPDWAINVND